MYVCMNIYNTSKTYVGVCVTHKSFWQNLTLPHFCLKALIESLNVAMFCFLNNLNFVLLHHKPFYREKQLTS